MLISVFSQREDSVPVSKWQVGAPIVVELDGQPFETTATAVTRGGAGLYVQVNVPVPLGTAVLIGRHWPPVSSGTPLDPCVRGRAAVRRFTVLM